MILTLCTVLAVFISTTFSAQAAVCTNSPDGVHHFDEHKRAGAGYSVDVGTHRYLYGYDENKNPIYKYDCRLTDYYEYCQNKCIYCNATYGSTHTHYVKTQHSVNHN